LAARHFAAPALPKICYFDKWGLNSWRRPEPQTRGETCLRSRNVFLFYVIPRRGIVCVEIPNQNLHTVCVRQESCHAAIGRCELLKLRRRNGAAVAGRMANRQTSRRSAGCRKWVIEKKPGEQKTRKNPPQRESATPHCVAREAHCSWFDTSTLSLAARWVNRMHSVFVFVKSLPELCQTSLEMSPPELEKKFPSSFLALPERHK